MIRISLLIISAVTLTALHGFAQERYVTEIPIESGERWWGTDGRGQSWDFHKEGTFTTNMLVSSAGRYLWSADPMEIAAQGEKLIVTSEMQKPEVQKGGKTLREAYLVCVHKNLPSGRLTPPADLLTHPLYRPANRPEITWGQQEILEYARRIVSEGLPAGTIVIPEGWCSVNVPFAFQRELYPDPEGMISELKEMGFKTMLTVTPRTPATGRIFSEAYRNGNIIESGAPSTHIILDLGDELCFEAFRRGFEELKSRYRFDGYRLECGCGCGDRMLRNWEKLCAGMEMFGMSGVYEMPFSPYVSDIYVPAGAQPSEYMFRNLFAAALSGCMYKTAPAIPRFPAENERAAYMTASLLLPVASVDFAPWELKEQKLYDGVKAALIFRASLAGYMDNLLKESARTGEPIVRHMEYQFPRQGFSDCDSQYMLGPKYLIVPCTGEQEKCMVRLPKGQWADKNGNRFKGPLVTETGCADGAVYFELLK